MVKSHFLRNVIILSFISVLFLPIYVFLFLHPSFVELITRDIEKESVRDTNHIASFLVGNEAELSRDSLPPTFERRVEALSKFNIVKLKVFSPSGEVIFSTDREDVGTINKEPYFHEIIAKGNPYTNVVKKTARSLENQLMQVDAVETYVPIMNDVTFLGAFELYYDITAKKSHFDKLIMRSTIVVFAILSILLCAVILSSIQAHRNLKERDRMEKELRKKERLDSLYTMTTSVAFDFDVLLNAITGEISKAKAVLNSPDLVKERLESAENASSKAKELAHELLTYARVIKPDNRTSLTDGEAMEFHKADEELEAP